MNIYHRRRPDASQALYIDGNLQFDSRDEAVYHESLALPALCLAYEPKRVLICGGGDGLVLREVLRFPNIESVTLIDCSPEILDLARTELSELNQNALDDARVTTVICDALEYPLADGSFDVIVCDFTFPTTKESALGFTVEWYKKLRRALAEGGILAINAVSPQNTASAFACLVATLRAAHFSTLPYRVCIPSFRDHGYGAWGFILAAKHGLTIDQVRNLQCPIPTAQADLPSLAHAARFSAKARYGFARAPINTTAKPILQALLLNPVAATQKSAADAPPDFPNLINEVEISHPYHSRGMIEALADQVLGSIHTIDLRKLVDELTARAKRLPQRIVDELARLREYLAQRVLDLDLWGKWAARLFATLIIVVTIANSISPDPAFAKGHAGLGHASFSRGSSSPESFGGGRSVANEPISGRGFTSSYGHDPVDIYGYHYEPRFYFYDRGAYFGGGGSSANRFQGQGHYDPQPHKPLFVLDDDLMAMENGDFLIPLSDSVFLVVAEGKVTLTDAKGGTPLLPIYADPKLFDNIRSEVNSQNGDLEREVGVRRDWLSWVSWTSSMFASVKADNEEFLNLQDMQRRFGVAIKRLGASMESQSITPLEGSVELFVGCHVLSDNRIVIYGPGGHSTYLDGHFMTGPGGSQIIPAPLKAALVSILKKMALECKQDIASDAAEAISLRTDLASTENDLATYQLIYSQNGYDPNYEVDYGTDSIGVNDAISRTQQDLNSIQTDQQLNLLSASKSKSDMERFQAALQAWSQ